MRELKLKQFKKLITDINTIIQNSGNEGILSKLLLLEKLINDFKNLKSSNVSKKNIDSLSQLNEILNEFSQLKTKVIEKRKIETKEKINKNKDKLKLSSFELMEHDFRENSHSNVLKYIFDYKFINDIGVNILSDFLEIANNNKIPNLKDKLLDKTYEIIREFSTNNGRIDLLIKDSKNKFINK